MKIKIDKYEDIIITSYNMVILLIPKRTTNVFLFTLRSDSTSLILLTHKTATAKKPIDAPTKILLRSNNSLL